VAHGASVRAALPGRRGDHDRGSYRITRDQTLLVLVPQLHRDPAVWGDRAEEFDPDRFAFSRAEQLPPNA
jgi:cytochrome P450 / NADPH-cytochrome P450 reductase